MRRPCPGGDFVQGCPTRAWQPGSSRRLPAPPREAMRRLLGAGALGVLLWGATGSFSAPERQSELRLSAGDKAPEVHYGRRQIPGDNDPYVLRDFSLDGAAGRD